MNITLLKEKLGKQFDLLSELEEKEIARLNKVTETKRLYVINECICKTADRLISLLR